MTSPAFGPKSSFAVRDKRRGIHNPVRRGYFAPMRWLRRSGSLTPYLAFVLSLAFLLPEIGHSLAHRHAMADAHATAEPTGADHDHSRAPASAHDPAAVTDRDHEDAHPHFDQRGTAPGKLSLTSLFATQVVVDLALDAVAARQVPPPVARQIVLTGRTHGPPSSSRAPPLS
jgi:hypothetical protein